MKKSNAERQKIYRERAKKQNQKRLNIYISEKADEHLFFLKGFHGMTQKELIEHLLDKAYRAMNRKIKRERDKGMEIKIMEQLECEWEEQLERIQAEEREKSNNQSVEK